MLICDGFGPYETFEVLEFCFANNIVLCRLPSHTSHKLQPCDIAVFVPLKAAYRDNVERLERAGVNTISKEHITSLYLPVRERAFSKRNILAGWSKAGPFPFNPERVLKALPNPELEIAGANRGMVSPGLQDARWSNPVTLVSPGTPTSAETFTMLHDLILDQDADELDERGKQRLRRHLQKFTKGAHTFLAKTALQHNQIQFLLRVNNKAKSRRSTKSIVLGNAKVMSFEDLVEARAKRAERDLVTANRRKGKRGQKRGPDAAKADVPHFKVSRISEASDSEEAPHRVLAVQHDPATAVPEQWRAPVAQMV